MEESSSSPHEDKSSAAGEDEEDVRMEESYSSPHEDKSSAAGEDEEDVQTEDSSSLPHEDNSSVAGEDDEVEEDVWMEREKNPNSPFTCKRNSADRNTVESIQSLQSSHDEVEEDVRMEREKNPNSPFTCRRNSSGRNPAERSQSLHSSLKDAYDKYSLQLYSLQLHYIKADLIIAERYKEALTETNKKLAEELHKAKEQSSKKLQDMKAELGKAELVNRDLDKRNKKLEKFYKARGQYWKARGQYWKKFLNIKAELVTANSQIKKLHKINKKLGGRIDEMKTECFTSSIKIGKLEEELNRAKERENSSKRNLEQTRNELQELCTTFAAVTEECDQACKQEEQPGAAPHLSKKRKYVLKVYEVNDWVNCSICLEPWTESGEHNACSLSCGHFFGRSCITQWISRNGNLGSSTCPVCSNRTTLRDIRRHYVSQIYDGKEKFEHAD